MLRRLALLLAVAVVSVGGVALAAAPGSAGEICKKYVENAQGVLEYTVVPCGSDGSGDDGSSGSGGGSGQGASCYLGRQQAFDYDVAFCKGDLSCYQFVPSVAYPDPADWPDRPSGVSDDAVYANQACFTQPPEEALVSNDYIWTEPATRTPAQQAAEAYGRLRAPAFQLAFNPPRRTLVSVPTWFWASGAPASSVTGSSAEGMVAVATPDHLDVDPGDGSGVRSCAFSVASSDECSYTYTRSSASQSARTSAGDPAFTARMRLVYRVEFRVNGSPTTIPGAPATFSSGWQDALVPVAEVQSVVTG